MLLFVSVVAVIALKMLGGGYKEKLIGKWYDKLGAYAFEFYSDGTCDINGYGSGTWNIVNKDMLKMTNFYGETEVGKIYSLNSKCLKLGDEGQSVFYRNMGDALEEKHKEESALDNVQQIKSEIVEASNDQSIVEPSISAVSEEIIMDRSVNELKRWQDAYSEVLRNKLSEDGDRYDPRFQLVYIDDDNIPELIYAPIDTHASGVQIYQFIDNEAVCVTDSSGFEYFGSSGEIYYLPRKNVILSADISMGIGYLEFEQLENNGNARLLNLSNVNWNETYEGGEVIYSVYMDGEHETLVDKNYFVENLNKMINGKNYIQAGYPTGLTINESNISLLYNDIIKLRGNDGSIYNFSNFLE